MTLFDLYTLAKADRYVQDAAAPEGTVHHWASGDVRKENGKWVPVEKAADQGPEKTSVRGIRQVFDPGKQPYIETDVSNKPKKMTAVLHSVNRNYYSEFDSEEEAYPYWNNCVRCCVTYELKRRGIAAKALFVKARSDYEQQFDKISDYYSNGFAKAYKNAKILPAPNRGCKGSGYDDIMKSMASWPDGSRCSIVIYKDYCYHNFMAEKVKGKVYFIDPVSGNHFNKKIFEGVQRGRTRYFRTDNLDLNEKVLNKCCRR